MLPNHGLLSACRADDLFGFPLWPIQEKLLQAIEEGPRMHVWALGRRSGKSTMSALVCLWACLMRDETLRPMLRPGEWGYAVAVATNTRQARLIVQAARSIVEESPLLSGAIDSSTEDEIKFRNGMALAAFPCTSRGSRGWPVHTLVMDEAAHFLSDTDGPQVADKVYAALSPATAQFGDFARIIISSTPWGEDGLFAQLFQQASSGELTDARAQKFITEDVNPTIEAKFLKQERARLGDDVFRSEYLAEFVGSGAAYLDPRRIEEATADRGELPPDYCKEWIAGLDPAFSSDPFGLAIVGRDRHHGSHLLVGLSRNWKPQKTVSFEERRALEDQVLDEVALVCLQYGVSHVVTDQYAAPAIVDYLRKKGLAVIPHPMTAISKTAVFGMLRARLNLGGLELYENPQLLSELRRLRTKHAAGSSNVVNPRVGGSHGDMAQALALAVAEYDRYGLVDAPIAPERDPGPDTQAFTHGIEEIARVGKRRPVHEVVF